MEFEILRSALVEAGAARLGRLAFPGRRRIDTPNFFAATSRGVVPHLTPDNLARHDDLVRGAYLAFEDFIERSQRNPNRVPPLLQAAARFPPPSPSPSASQPPRRPLHAFCALPDAAPVVLGPRRVPAAANQLGNGPDSVSVFTSTGVQTLTTAAYADAVVALRPDVVVPMADLAWSPVAPGGKRAARMADRTDDWMVGLRRRLLEQHQQSGLLSSTAVFAPTLPVPHAVQWDYLRSLSEDMLDFVSGLAVYDVDIIPDLPAYPGLAALPRLSFDVPATPHHILRQVSLGVDVVLLPVVNTASEAGVAFTFAFPAPPPPPPPPPTSSTAAAAEQILPLAVDLTLPEHTTSLTPLSPGCTCPACATHHAAYLHHLLAAREMLAWTLLQLHNHHVSAAFFAGIRASLAAGTFERDAADFAARYEPDMPEGRGERPRVRGYAAGRTQQQPDEPAPQKLNRPAWGKLGAVAAEAAAAAQGPQVDGTVAATA
ncbi:hypothetical protein RB595_006662 [Gaeumannomyces hyphopodioides]